MWKRNFKIFLLTVILLNLKMNLCQEDDSEITIEDEPTEKDLRDINENTNEGKIPKTRNLNDDEEEFDDPILLHERLKKGGKGMPGKPYHPHHGIPNLEKGQYRESPEYPSGANNRIPQQGEVLTQPEISEKNMYLAFYEILMICFVAGFILNCMIGKRTNEGIATKWYTVNKLFFAENYAHIGVTSEYNTKAGVPILKESYNNFKFYSSGRVFTKWMLVNFDLKKRQDLVSLCTSIFLFNEKDRIIYETSLVPANELPLVFCVCKKKDVKSMKKNYSDIDYFTKPNNPPFMQDNLVLLTEDYEVFDQIFEEKEFLSLYQKVEKFIDIIYFTDRQSYSKEQYAIYFSFDITYSKNSDEDFENLTLFVHYFIDMLSVARISTTFRKESERMRTEFDKVRAKELQEKNAEEMKQKKLEKMNQKNKKPLTKEQAQKLEEKEKKDALKNQKKKQIKVLKK